MTNHSTFDIYCNGVVCYTFFGSNFIKRKLSQLTAPAIAGVVKEKGTKAAIAYQANGKAGMLTRIIDPLLGGQIAYRGKCYGADRSADGGDSRSKCEKNYGGLI